MRIGLVCPYSWDVPGGVQFHIRDLAGELLRRGHHVSVLTPSSHADLPEWATTVGAAVPIRFNGSVARLSFGPLVSARVRRWLDEGNFDVLHVHEPTTPSISMLAVMSTDVPVVATFHSRMDRSYAREVTAGMVRPLMERISVRIAVSSEARKTLIEHHGGDAVIIPNGVETRAFRQARPIEEWRESRDSPVVVFLGRLDEPRKGLPVFAAAIPAVLRESLGVRFLIAGRGVADHVRDELGPVSGHVQFLGEITDPQKESLLRGATVYVAPQTGGESFGIVLVEAMAAGCAVVASDLEAFRAVLDDGAAGVLFPVGDAAALAAALVRVLQDDVARQRIARAGERRSAQYDWSVIADRILLAYQAAIDTARPENERTSTLELLLGHRVRGGTA